MLVKFVKTKYISTLEIHTNYYIMLNRFIALIDAQLLSVFSSAEKLNQGALKDS